MHIAMIAPQGLKTVGGPTNYIKNLKLSLERTGFAVSVLADETNENERAFDGLPLLRQLQLFKSLVRIKPDVVHIHGRLHHIPAAALYRAVHNRKARLIFTFHTQPRLKDYLGSGSSAEVLSYRGIAGRIGTTLLNACDEVVSVSENLIANINRHCDMRVTRYSVIHSGAVVSAPDDAATTRFVEENALCEASPVLASIGVLSWDWKVAGHKIAIEALAALKDKYPKIKLLIVGDGQYRDYLEAAADSCGVANSVVFCGNMNDPSIALHVCDIYVHMALNEALGIAIIEAMMAKGAIVAACAGGIPEIIESGRTGILVEPTASALADTINELVSDADLRTRLGQNAFDYATENLNWAKISDQYLALYTKEAGR